LRDKVSQLTHRCFAFHGFTFRDAAGQALNSTVSSQIVCSVIYRQDHWYSTGFIFKMAKRRGDAALYKKLDILEN